MNMNVNLNFIEILSTSIWVMKDLKKNKERFKHKRCYELLTMSNTREFHSDDKCYVLKY